MLLEISSLHPKKTFFLGCSLLVEGYVLRARPPLGHDFSARVGALRALSRYNDLSFRNRCCHLPLRWSCRSFREEKGFELVVSSSEAASQSLTLELHVSGTWRPLI